MGRLSKYSIYLRKRSDDACHEKTIWSNECVSYGFRLRRASTTTIRAIFS